MRIGDFRASYAHDEALLATPVQRSWMIGFVLLVLLFPWIGGSYLTYLACLTGIHVIAAMGLNIVTGYAGQISLGHAAFMGVGCYTVAALARMDVPFYLALPAGGLISALVGIVVGIPSLRIKGLYLAVATLAAQFIFPLQPLSAAVLTWVLSVATFPLLRRKTDGATHVCWTIAFGMVFSLLLYVAISTSRRGPFELPLDWN
jgi:ABC-type branched-subunit amino acid transport system permease subunit